MNNGTERILIVEDEPAIALMESKELEDAGFKTKTVGCGKDALLQLKEESYDLLLIDQKLPDMKGSEIVKHLGKRVHNLPVVVVTAHGDEHLAVEMLKSGVADYIVKDSNLKFIHSLPSVVNGSIKSFNMEAKNRMLQTQLEKSEETFHKTFEAIPDPTYLCERLADGEIIITQCNKACKVFFKDSVTECIGKEIDEYFIMAPEIATNIRHTMSTGKKKLEEVSIKLPVTGDGKWLEINYVKFKDEGVLVIIKDVTERRNIEDKQGSLNEVLEQRVIERTKELEEKEEKLRNIVDIIPDTIYRLDQDGYFTYISQGAINIGFDSDDLIGKHFAKIVHPDDQEQARFRFNERRKGERATRCLEIRIINPDKEDRTCEIRAVPILLNATGVYSNYVDSTESNSEKYIGTQGVIRDITERKKSEVQISKLSNAIEQSPVTVVITDTKGDIEYVNPKFVQLTGFSHEEIIGQNTRMLKSDEQGPEIYKDLWETITSGNVWYGEFRNKKKNGDLYWEYASISPVRDTKGVITNFVAVKEDITERRIANEQIKASLKEKELLLKEIHHRVKNNMQIISSLISLQSNHIEDKQSLTILKECHNRIKTMSLIHEGLYQKDDLAEIDFAEYIKSLSKNILKSYATRPDKILLKTNANNVFLGIDTAIPCGLIINELLTNSLKYAFPEDRIGELTVSIREKKGPSQTPDHKPEMELIVSDNGIGLPEELDFEKTKTLGLELVNTLTQQLDGTIELNRSKGTEFKITFNVESSNNHN